ncbi:Prolipoprotein diacylglyceryl transferase [Providencia rettgeri]|uniref:Prolipoprotein diacylglyceryl transferase n=1 Tax=Providencia rettgeri TaxID=587 RepID=A0A379FV02_PRORE|nr:Prolipoprotein diacylglyceryl transferase [Providencia rettgeri]
MIKKWGTMSNNYLAFPEIDPVMFSIGPVSLHWYGFMYLVGFVFALWLAGRRAAKPNSGWTKNEVENLLYVGFVGVFVGGRLGYVSSIISLFFLTILYTSLRFGMAVCPSMGLNRCDMCHDVVCSSYSPSFPASF